MAGIVTALWGIAEGVVTGIRANGPIVDPNAWATVNNLFFFMLFAVYLTVPQLRRMALCGLAIFAAAVFASYSRTGLVVFAAGLGLVTLLAWRIAEHRRPLLQLAAAVAAVYLLLNLPVHNAIVSYAPFTLARIIHEEVKRELYKSLSCVKIVFANRYLNTKKAFA